MRPLHELEFQVLLFARTLRTPRPAPTDSTKSDNAREIRGSHERRISQLEKDSSTYAPEDSFVLGNASSFTERLATCDLQHQARIAMAKKAYPRATVKKIIKAHSNMAMSKNADVTVRTDASRNDNDDTDKNG
ncbi:hypothetical protein E4U42_002403 [Claviceps africana]|uniref:Uncharacterized protein n=1 Tax=Claviceps africana TaxID=83212 RepID=A0A8K0NJJ4_9HYPO|nr:hypothetical protein E4U42_002403 [Claviceps africana]